MNPSNPGGEPTDFEPPSGVREAFRRATAPILVTHVYPDGDAIGSQLGLARAFRARGASPRLFVAHPAPLLQEFLDPRGEVEVVLEGRLSRDQREALDEADYVFVLDTSDPRRLGELQASVFSVAARKILIDHHLTDDFSAFDESWCVPASPATGLLVERLLRSEGVPLSRELAEPLFVALAMDTGWFRFSNASAAAFETAARLVAAGADPAYLHLALYENSSLGRTQVLGRMLSQLESNSTGRIIWSVVRRSEVERYGVTVEDVDGFIDSLKAVRGAEILILFVEVSTGSYKVSLRSKGAADVHRLASEFGGGGHAKAAGFRLSCRDVDSVVPGAGEPAISSELARERQIVRRVLEAAELSLA